MVEFMRLGWSVEVTAEDSLEQVDTEQSTSPGARVFFLGAGFSKPAGLPLMSELVAQVRRVARERLSIDGYNHLEGGIDRYLAFLGDTDPTKAFDLEEFGAWLD